MKNLVYKKGNILFGFIEDNYLYTANGIAVCKIEDNICYCKDGTYVGEFNHFKELVYVAKHKGLMISGFTLPENKAPLSKKYQLLSVTKVLGSLSKPTPVVACDEHQFPSPEELANK